MALLLSRTDLERLLDVESVIEAVQQLRPGGVCDDLCNGPHTFDRTICRQVRDAEIALCCWNQ